MHQDEVDMTYFGAVYDNFGAGNSFQLQRHVADTPCTVFPPVDFSPLENWLNIGQSTEPRHQRHLEMPYSAFCQHGGLGNIHQMTAHSCCEQFLTSRGTVSGSGGKCHSVAQEIKDGEYNKTSPFVNARICHDNSDVIKQGDNTGSTRPDITRVVWPTRRRVLTERLINITRHYKHVNAAITQVNFRQKLVQDGWYTTDAVPSATTIGRAFSRVKHETLSLDCSDKLQSSTVVHRKRVTFDTDQRQILNKTFKRCQYPTSLEYDSIVNMTGLYRETIKVWFSNKRAKLRRERQANHQPDVQQMAAPTESSGEFWIETADTNIQHGQPVATMDGSQDLLPPSDHPVNYIAARYNPMNDVSMTSYYGVDPEGEAGFAQQNRYIFPCNNQKL